MVRELLADYHALAVSQGAPRGGGSPLRPNFPRRGKPGKATRCLPDPAPSKEEGTRICRDVFIAWLLSNPTCMRARAPKGNHCACRAAGKNGSHATKDVATRRRATRSGTGLPKAKPATRGAPPGTLPYRKNPLSLRPKGRRRPLPPPTGGKGNCPPKGVLLLLLLLQLQLPRIG